MHRWWKPACGWSKIHFQRTGNKFWSHVQPEDSLTKRSKRGSLWFFHFCSELIPDLRLNPAILPAFKGATPINSVYQYRAERLVWDMLEIDHCNHKFHDDQPWWSTLVTQVNHLLFQQSWILWIHLATRVSHSKGPTAGAGSWIGEGAWPHGEWWRKMVRSCYLFISQPDWF